MKKRIYLIMLSLSLLLTQGCMFSNDEELFRLPQMPPDSEALSARLEEMTAQGGSLTAPQSGANRQSVQMVDLDGDGEQEALACFRFTGEKPLRIAIYKKVGDQFERAALIEEDANSVESVQYADLTGDGKNNIIVMWRVGGQTLRGVSVYALEAEGCRELVSTYCTALNLYDLTGDGIRDMVVLNLAPDTLTGKAELMTFKDGTAEVHPAVALSDGIEGIGRIVQGALINKVPALLVGSVIDGNKTVTDILACRYGELTNITLNAETGRSDGTVRDWAVYATDIDKDGTTEVPTLELLPSVTGESADAQWKIEWSRYHLSGEDTPVFSTYHNYTDGWFFVLPDSWVGRLSVSRTDTSATVKTTVFSQWRYNEEPQTLMTVYTLTGDRRQELAEQEGRFILAQTSDMVIACTLTPATQGLPTISRDEALAAFKLIEREWQSGE